jgi:hypothetical protein
MMMMKNDESNSTGKAFSSTPSNLCKEISIFCIGVVAEDDGYHRLNGLCKARVVYLYP